MKILILHNAYRQRGGEDSVVAAEASMLRDAGHKVHLEIISNNSIEGVVSKLQAFRNTPYDSARKGWLADLLTDVHPDIVHIHNFFPLLTPAIHEAAHEAGVAVVQTLHNFRILCAGALFVREGRICDKCLGGNRVWGVVHRCYRGSLPGSLALVRMQNRAMRHKTWSRHVHRFIALTEFSKKIFVEGGLPSENIAVKPNFVARAATSMTTRSGALFVGRLSPEKGLDVLLDAWLELSHIPLTIAGDGPENDRLRQNAPANVTFLGAVSPSKVRELMQRSRCLIMPSIWYETFGLTIVEAFAANLPVIASRHGAMQEIVMDGITGLHFTPGDSFDLRNKVTAAFANPKALVAMGLEAHKAYEKNYTPEANLKLLEGIYFDAIAEQKTP